MSKKAVIGTNATTIRFAPGSEIHYLPSSELRAGCARHGNALSAICDTPCRESGWSLLRKLAREWGK